MTSSTRTFPLGAYSRELTEEELSAISRDVVRCSLDRLVTQLRREAEVFAHEYALTSTEWYGPSAVEFNRYLWNFARMIRKVEESKELVGSTAVAMALPREVTDQFKKGDDV